MAACVLVVLVAFGSACTKNYQIERDAFRTLQKNGAPRVVKTVDGYYLNDPVESELSIVHKDTELPVSHSFEMTDTEIKWVWRAKPTIGKVTDLTSIHNIPLSEVETYQVRHVSGEYTVLGILGGLAVVVLCLAGMWFLTKPDFGPGEPPH